MHYAFPLGSSVLSIPLVAVNRFVLGNSVVDENGRFSRQAEIAAQRNFAALLMAALVACLFLAARTVLPETWSVLAAFGSRSRIAGLEHRIARNVVSHVADPAARSGDHSSVENVRGPGGARDRLPSRPLSLSCSSFAPRLWCPRRRSGSIS